MYHANAPSHNFPENKDVQQCRYPRCDERLDTDTKKSVYLLARKRIKPYEIKVLHVRVIRG